MTRINADLSPIILADQHLLAEYNEIGLFFASLRRSLKSKNGLPKIPEQFTLNKGHVTFFYSRLTFVINRYERIKIELKTRGFILDPNRVIYLENEFPAHLYNDWTADDAATSIIKERIRQKIAMKPKWYRYYKKQVPQWVINNYA